ncbi:hypothetical protein D3C81_1220130 [compost metagenome]
MAGTLQAIAQPDRQLQLESTEHRQGQQHKQAGQAAEQPGLLQPGLKTSPQQRGNHPEGGVHQRHTQYVNAGQCPATAGTHAITEDQPGENRQHRQRAGGKGQQQAQAQKGQQAPGQARLLQAAGQGLIAGLLLLIDSGAAQADQVGLWWIAQAGIGTALPAHAQLACGGGGQDQFKFTAIHQSLAEELVLMGQGLWQGGLLLDGQAVELQAFLVKIVTIGDFPVQAHLPGIQPLAAEHERLVHRQKVALGKGVGLGQAAEQEHQGN